MANFKLKVKRNTSNPATGTLDSGELGYNTSSKVLFVGNGSGQAASAVSMDGHLHSLASLSDTAISSPQDGQVLVYNSTSGKWENDTISGGSGGTGTVTSVGLSLPNIFSVSGSPVTASGTLTATFTTQAANIVFAGPSTGSAAVPTFRSLVAADIPTLNQNTTGSAATLTTARTLTIGATGKTFNGSANVSWSLAEIGAQAAGSYLTGNQTITLSGDVTGSGATAITTTIAGGAVTLAKMANLAANSIIGNNTGSAATPIALTAAQVRTLINVADGATANTGTVTSVATGGGLTGGTITTSGTISHADTSSQASITASARTYITAVTLDTYGHVTALSTGTETVTDTTYSEISTAEIDSTTNSTGRLITGRRFQYGLRNTETGTTTLNLATGATTNGLTKTVNIGTSGAAGSTTNINIGSSIAGTTTISSPTVSISGNLSVAGNLTVRDVEMISTSNGIIFEGSTNDAFETTLNAIDPTADRTISLPNSSGTVVLIEAKAAGKFYTGTTAPTNTTRLNYDGDLFVTNFTAGTITETSSIKYKENIKPLNISLETINKLSGVTYDLKDKSFVNEIGMIAEEVFEVIPNLVTLDEKGEPNGIKYQRLSVILLEAVKELKDEIEILKQEIKDLKGR
jgi:hypothetical protein